MSIHSDAYSRFLDTMVVAQPGDVAVSNMSPWAYRCVGRNRWLRMGYTGRIYDNKNVYISLVAYSGQSTWWVY